MVIASFVINYSFQFSTDNLEARRHGVRNHASTLNGRRVRCHLGIGLLLRLLHDVHHLGSSQVCPDFLLHNPSVKIPPPNNPRYQNEVQTSEMFNTAGRTVKSGLVSSAVVSSWTWAATLMQSTAVCYNYGISGPFWYASGATVQIILFATLAIELKRRAPNAHTFLEVVRARYGAFAHITFMVFGLMTNILVTAMLLAGGSAVANSLTGVPVAAACFLLPVGVVMYTAFGGIKATFITDYIHT